MLLVQTAKGIHEQSSDTSAGRASANQIPDVLAQWQWARKLIVVIDRLHLAFCTCRVNLDQDLFLEAAPAFSHGRLTTRTQKPSPTTARVLLGAGEVEERLRMEQLPGAKQRTVCVASCHELCSIG